MIAIWCATRPSGHDALGWIALYIMARPLNLLAAGEETALYLGVKVQSITRLAYFIASVLVGATVASCGAIGFVGLIVPHAVRMLWGSDWPCVQYEATANYAGSVSFLDRVVSDAEDRHALLWTTPAALFGFSASSRL